jgi:beta-ketoacyl-acyl-carrier-protein synthase II
MERPRVVITGLGTINPLGKTVAGTWDALLSGTSGIGRITSFDASQYPSQIAGEARDFDPLDYMDRKTARRLPRAVHFAVAAAGQAIEDAGLSIPMRDPRRCGVMIGTGVAGIDNILAADRKLHSEGYRKLNPYQVPSGIPNIPAFQISKQFQCLGPNNTTTTACAAGTQAVGEGAEYIRRGVADIVLAGGTEALVMELVAGAFAAMRALATSYNQRPQAASRPFNADREGFVLAEGSAILVLENLDHAEQRGARIYAEVIGHSSSSDAFDIAAMRPDGSGAIHAMQGALADAGLESRAVGYINAHGTSTVINDKTETRAIKQVFGDDAYRIPVSSTKSMLGHAMGASGALEALVCALVITQGMIPPTINYELPDPECDLDYVPNQALQKRVDITLSNSFGLGGQNACLVLRRYNQE